MPRSTNNVASRARRKKVLRRAKGYYMGRRKFFQNAKETVKRGLRYAFRDRRQRKREFRRLWIARINAATRDNGLTYSRFIKGLDLLGIELDRKSLSDLATRDADGFRQICEQVASALEKASATSAA